MDIVIKNAGALALTLTEIHETMLRLTQCALSKEKALREDDIAQLKDILSRKRKLL